MPLSDKLDLADAPPAHLQGYLENALDRLPFLYIGDHALLHQTEDKYEIWVCINCEWEHCYLTEGRTPREQRLLKEYTYGWALDTDCPDNRDPEMNVSQQGHTLNLDIGVETKSTLKHINSSITATMDVPNGDTG